MISRGNASLSRLLSGAVLTLSLGLLISAPALAQAPDLSASSAPAPASKDEAAKNSPVTEEENVPAWKITWRKQHPAEARQALAAKAAAQKASAVTPPADTAQKADPGKTPPTVTPDKNTTNVPAAVAAKTPATPSAKSPEPPAANSAFSETKPDGPEASAPALSDRTQDSPFTAVKDAWKMLLYLVPTLLLIVGILAGLRRFQERNGRLPGALQGAVRRQAGRKVAPSGVGWMGALVAGLQQNRDKQRGSSAIRLVESVPMGGSFLHLVEVRGRLLLLGASGGGLALLTEFTETKSLETEDFSALLHAAAADLDTLDADTNELPPSILVGSLESGLRDTSDALARRARRLRTVQEEEEAFVERGSKERKR